MATMRENIIELDSVTKTYGGSGLFARRKGQSRAVSEVSLNILRGETYGIVGESGSGKTTLAHLILGILKTDAGHIFIKNEEVLNSDFSSGSMSNVIQFVFQDPFGALNPRKTVGWSIEEALHIHNIGERRSRKDKTLEMMSRVGLSKSYYDRYPRQLSGGQRQRVAIASALILTPEILVIDEGVSALDVSIQASILNLLNELKTSMNLTLVFITHDLNVVQYFCDRVAVIKDGELKEVFEVDTFYEDSHHPYTEHLFESTLKH